MCERLRVAVALIILSTGCIPTLEENPARDVSKAVPNAFRQADAVLTELDGGLIEPADAGTSVAQVNWNEFFTAPELRSLIELALKNNQELNITVQEIIIAQNEVSARRGELFPKVGAGLTTGIEKVGGETWRGYSDKATGVPENLGNFGFGLTASWEVDIWGKLRGAANAADFRFRASTEGRNFLVTQLVSEIARSYFELVALDGELEVLERNITIQTDALEVVKAEKLAARVTQLAVQRFEAEVLKNKSRLYDKRQERVQAENRINFLVGRFPQPVARNAGPLTSPLPAMLATGVPSELLTNRPDVRRAELQLEAAKLDVKVARTRFFPAFSIEAAIGYNSFSITHLVNTPESLLYNLAGNLIAPLINRAGIEADYRSANARQIQAVFEYERTVLQAYTDVVNQLVKYDNLQKSYALQSQQVDLLASSVDVSTVLFQSARADYMEVLLTRRDSLDAQLELIETRQRLLLSMVNIYQSLGGGWRQ
ncbi:MAG: TolC family protein [Archangium sp.]|nr:TolC family protein [Archangium sp.]